MLCDRLIVEAQAPGAGLREERLFVREIAGHVREAERFVLSHEAVDVVLDVQETRPSSLMAGLGICRLPAKKVWIEFDCKYRMDGMGRYGYVPEYPAHLKSILNGFLLIASDDTYRRGRMYLVHCQNGGIFVNYEHCEFDFSKLDENTVYAERQRRGKASSAETVMFDAATKGDDRDFSSRFADQPREAEALAQMENLFQHVVADKAFDWFRAMEARVAAGKWSRAQFREMMKVNRKNWGGEPRFLLGLMMMLNSRNLAAFEDQSVVQKNRARGVREPRAVVSHRTVKLKLSKVQQNRLASGIGVTGNMAWHKVRGHWKVRKTGVFFWRPFERGAKQAGIVTHDYHVEA